MIEGQKFVEKVKPLTTQLHHGKVEFTLFCWMKLFHGVEEELFFVNFYSVQIEVILKIGTLFVGDSWEGQTRLSILMESISHQKPSFRLFLQKSVEKSECLSSDKLIIAVDIDHKFIVLTMLLDELGLDLQVGLVQGIMKSIECSNFFRNKLIVVVSLGLVGVDGSENKGKVLILLMR